MVSDFSISVNTLKRVFPASGRATSFHRAFETEGLCFHKKSEKKERKEAYQNQFKKIFTKNFSIDNLTSKEKNKKEIKVSRNLFLQFKDLTQ